MRRFTIFFLFLVGQSYAQQTLGLFTAEEGTFPGYVLFAPSNSKNTYLIDNCGELIHQWEHNFGPGEATYLLENGNLIRTQRRGGSNINGGGLGGGLEIRDWDGNILWEYLINTNDYHTHHDIELLPNGNILVLAWSLVSKAEVVGLGRNPDWVSNLGMYEEVILELKILENNDAEIVWEWRAFDHIIQDFDSTKSAYGVVEEHPELIDFNYVAQGGGVGGGQQDWLHLNAVDYHDSLKQIAISSRRFSEIWIIEYSDSTSIAAGHQGGKYGKGGDLLYRWGNPEAYRRGQASDQQFYGQHNVQWIPKSYQDGGGLIVFNNGIDRPGGNYSSVDVIIPPLQEDGNYSIDSGASFQPEVISWSYAADPPSSLFSSNISGASRLENGNTLICQGRKGKFYEVDYNGNIVWHYVSPIGISGPLPQGVTTNSNVFRAEKYGLDYPAFIGKTLEAMGPLELDPLPSECNLTTDITDIDHQSIRIYPNPANQKLVLESHQHIRSLMVYQHTGKIFKKLFYRTKNAELPTGSWPSGIYYLLINGRQMEKLVVMH